MMRKWLLRPRYGRIKQAQAVEMTY